MKKSYHSSEVPTRLATMTRRTDEAWVVTGLGRIGAPSWADSGRCCFSTDPTTSLRNRRQLTASTSESCASRLPGRRADLPGVEVPVTAGRGAHGYRRPSDERDPGRLPRRVWPPDAGESLRAAEDDRPLTFRGGTERATRVVVPSWWPK